MKPHINLALLSQENTQVLRHRASCLIDTGSTLPLIINKQIWQILGKPKLAKNKIKLSVANNQIIEVSACSLILSIEQFEDEDIEIPLKAAIIPNEAEAVIGGPVLKTICQHTNTSFVIDYLRNRAGFFKIPQTS